MVVRSVIPVTVATAGVRVPVTVDPTLTADEIFFEAQDTNTGTIYIGGNNVSSTNYWSALAKLDSLDWSGADFTGRPRQNEIQLSTIYVDASANGQTVMVSFSKKLL